MVTLSFSVQHVSLLEAMVQSEDLVACVFSLQRAACSVPGTMLGVEVAV